MVQIAGKYENVKNENYKEHLLAMGIDAKWLENIDKAQATVDIVQDGNTYTFNYKSGADTYTSKLIVGQEVEATTPSGQTIKTTTKLDGNVLTATQKLQDGVTKTNVYEFSDSGLVIKTTTDKAGIPNATRTYKRL